MFEGVERTSEVEGMRSHVPRPIEVKYSSSADRRELARDAETVRILETGIYRTQLLLACEGLLTSRQCDYLRHQIPTAANAGESLETALYNLALLWLREVFFDRKDHEALERVSDERAQRNLMELQGAEAMQEAKDRLASVGVREPR